MLPWWVEQKKTQQATEGFGEDHCVQTADGMRKSEGVEVEPSFSLTEHQLTKSSFDSWKTLLQSVSWWFRSLCIETGKGNKCFYVTLTSHISFQGHTYNHFSCFLITGSTLTLISLFQSIRLLTSEQMDGKQAWLWEWSKRMIFFFFLSLWFLPLSSRDVISKSNQLCLK